MGRDKESKEERKEERDEGEMIGKTSSFKTKPRTAE